MDTFKIVRTALFVPGTRPERFAKALASGADVVIIDLEDAVERDAKDIARKNLGQFAAGNPGASFLVRINDAAAPWFNSDLDVCGELPNVAGIMLPKAESAGQVGDAAAVGKPVFPIVESARGLHALDGIAGAAGVGRLTFGALDLMLDLGITPDTPAAATLLNQVRYDVLVQSRVHGLDAPIDTIHPDFADTDGLAAAARQACDMGFGGMLCIHPAQVDVVHRAFMPSSQELAWARRVVAEAEASGSYAFKLDGKMVDLPVIERARRTVARAG